MRGLFLGNLIIILPGKQQPKQSTQTMCNEQDIEEKESDDHKRLLYQKVTYNSTEGDVELIYNNVQSKTLVFIELRTEISAQ